MNMFDRISEGYYNNNFPYANKKEDPTSYALYSTRQQEIYAEFKADALKYAGLKHHEKAEKAWYMAYERGHSGGYQEVLSELLELADLLLGSP
jgi:hypothetical protein